MIFLLALGPVLTKTKKQKLKKMENVFFHYFKKKKSDHMKENPTLDTEIIVTRTDGRRTNFDFMSFAYIVKQS